MKINYAKMIGGKVINILWLKYVFLTMLKLIICGKKGGDERQRKKGNKDLGKKDSFFVEWVSILFLLDLCKSATIYIIIIKVHFSHFFSNFSWEIYFFCCWWLDCIWKSHQLLVEKLLHLISSPCLNCNVDGTWRYNWRVGCLRGLEYYFEVFDNKE